MMGTVYKYESKNAQAREITDPLLAQLYTVPVRGHS